MRVDRACWSRTFHAVSRSHAGDGTGVSYHIRDVSRATYVQLVGGERACAQAEGAGGQAIYDYSHSAHGELSVWAHSDCAANKQHWSARSPKDTNATLWSGFHVKSNPTDSSPPRTFMHLGDTGSAGRNADCCTS